MVINTSIPLSLYIHVYVFIMYIFFACVIEIRRFNLNIVLREFNVKKKVNIY